MKYLPLPVKDLIIYIGLVLPWLCMLVYHARLEQQHARQHAAIRKQIDSLSHRWPFDYYDNFTTDITLVYPDTTIVAIKPRKK